MRITTPSPLTLQKDSRHQDRTPKLPPLLLPPPRSKAQRVLPRLLLRTDRCSPFLLLRRTPMVHIAGADASRVAKRSPAPRQAADQRLDQATHWPANRLEPF